MMTRLPLLALFLAACGGCASGPELVTRTAADSLATVAADSASAEMRDMFHRWAGFTVWDCRYPQPVRWVNERHIDGEYGPGLRAHERAHAYTAVLFGDCAAYQAWRDKPAASLIMEAFAFCQQARTDTHTGRVPSIEAAISEWGQRLAAQYGTGLTAQEATVVVALFCSAPMLVGGVP